MLIVQLYTCMSVCAAYMSMLLGNDLQAKNGPYVNLINTYRWSDVKRLPGFLCDLNTAFDCLTCVFISLPLLEHFLVVLAQPEHA